jgi:hypothetical protein
MIKQTMHLRVAVGLLRQILFQMLFGNTTIAAFVNNQGYGIFGVDQTEAGVIDRGVTPGWNLVRTGTGPIRTVSVANIGAGFVTGETITVSNGTSNGVLTITANGFVGNATTNASPGNISSVAVTSGGSGFAVNTAPVLTFNREEYLSTLTVTGTASGYSNTDTVVVFGNATVAAITNATAAITTNSTGGTLTFRITNIGLFSNAFTNTAASSTSNVRVLILAANGANSPGTGATITANVVSSTGGSVVVTTLGGRAGRRQYETLAVVRSMKNSDADAEDTIFPDA